MEVIQVMLEELPGIVTEGGLVAQRLEQRTHNGLGGYCYHWVFNTLQAIERVKKPLVGQY
jgi:hypothetical protein